MEWVVRMLRKGGLRLIINGVNGKQPTHKKMMGMVRIERKAKQPKMEWWGKEGINKPRGREGEGVYWTVEKACM